MISISGLEFDGEELTWDEARGWSDSKALSTLLEEARTLYNADVESKTPPPEPKRPVGRPANPDKAKRGLGRPVLVTERDWEESEFAREGGWKSSGDAVKDYLEKPGAVNKWREERIAAGTHPFYKDGIKTGATKAAI